MKRLAAIALLLSAFGALMHFWPSDNPSSLAPSTSGNAPPGESRAAPTGSPPTSQPSYATQAPTSPQTSAPPTAARPASAAARIDIRTPRAVPSGETFSVTVEVQAPAGIRQLAFSLTYRKSILRLVHWTAGAFAKQGGASVQFEDVSEGSLLVRVDGGVVAGAGTVAALEFQALAPGVSPLSIEDVSYVDVARNVTVNRPTAYEGSIAVE